MFCQFFPRFLQDLKKINGRRRVKNFENRSTVLSWPKLGLEPKFHDPGTFGGFGKREQTDIQDSCFISIDL